MFGAPAKEPGLRAQRTSPSSSASIRTPSIAQETCRELAERLRRPDGLLPGPAARLRGGVRADRRAVKLQELWPLGEARSGARRTRAAVAPDPWMPSDGEVDPRRRGRADPRRGQGPGGRRHPSAARSGTGRCPRASSSAASTRSRSAVRECRGGDRVHPGPRRAAAHPALPGDGAPKVVEYWRASVGQRGVRREQGGRPAALAVAPGGRAR